MNLTPSTPLRRLTGLTTLAALAAVVPGLGSHAGASSSALAASAVVVGDTLIVTGDDAPNTIQLAADADPALFHVVIDGVAQTFNRADFRAISVSANGGDDSVQAGNGMSDKQLTVDGGSGDDTIIGGDGADLLLGGDGNDAVNGGRGADTGLLGAGDDSFTWNPGDGSDVTEGQSGDDTLVFNGANIAESMSLDANGGRVRFFRDVATITMDFDGVERFALRALGGTDRLTIGDLTGTDLEVADVDLSASTGSADAAADSVTVKGTADKDHVKVGFDSGVASVTGLPADVQITGSDADVDHLQIDTLGGRDKVTVEGTSASTIQVTTDLGEQ